VVTRCGKRFPLFRRDGTPTQSPCGTRAGELAPGTFFPCGVGPLQTREGFALVVVEERRPAELDAATRQRLRDELFDRWLADANREAALDLAVVGTAG
jgi:hypothetical protein